MPDMELTREYLGGAALAGDCGHVVGDNGDGTVNLLLTRRDCQPMPHLPVPSVSKQDLKPCHCDE